MAQMNEILNKLKAIEQRLTKIEGGMGESVLKEIKEKLDSIDNRLGSAEQCADEKERARSLVFIGIDESLEQRPSARLKADEKAVENVLDELGVEARATVYRLGKPDPVRKGPRLLKVILPAKSFQWMSLGQWKKRRDEMRERPEWSRLLIRPSLTPEQLEADKKERQKRWLERKDIDERSKNIYDRKHKTNGKN
jgi:50S ribosomal subunit-associated GTPase HflX